MFLVPPERVVELLADVRVVLCGSSAARLLGWAVPKGTWPVDAYVVETELVPIAEQYALERDDHSADLLLRTVQELWPFGPHRRVVPGVVAALDLARAADVRLAELGSGHLAEFARAIVADWRQRPPRRQPFRPVVPTGPPAHTQRPRHAAADLVWDDRAEQNANQLVALLFVAATPLRRAELAETVRISQGRISRAYTILYADPPRGLRLQEAGDELGLVSAPEWATVVERHLGQPKPEPLSHAALDTLGIIAYEQPVTRSDVRTIRGVDSDAVIETLRARGLVVEDPRFGVRGRPAFLITTPAFLRYFGLSALGDLPPRPTPIAS